MKVELKMNDKSVQAEISEGHASNTRNPSCGSSSVR